MGQTHLITNSPRTTLELAVRFSISDCIGGYTIDSAESFSWPENFVEDGNETVYTTLPRHSVIAGLATGGEVCDLDFIGETYSVGMKNGVLIADGVWLGPDQGQTSAIQFAPGQFVSSVSCRTNEITFFFALNYSNIKTRRLTNLYRYIKFRSHISTFVV